MMRWLFADDSESDQAYARKVLLAIKNQALQVLVPSIWVYESAFVVNYYTQKDAISHENSIHHLKYLFDLCLVARCEETPASLFGFSYNNGLSSYDSAYLMLAQQQGCALATLDKKLSKVAGISGCSLFAPE